MTSSALNLAAVTADAALSDGRIAAYRDGYVYVGVTGSGGDGLAVFDVSTPTSPTKVAQTDDVDKGRGVVLDGEVAFVSGRDDGSIASYDISDPTSPVLLDVLVDAGQLGARGLIVNGDRLHVLCGILGGVGTDGIASYDISDPADLSVTARVTSEDDADAIPSGYGVLTRNTIWCGYYTGSGSEIVAYDVTDPDAPTVRTSFDADGIAGCRGVHLKDGRWLFVVGEGSSSLIVLDVSNIDSPSQIATLTDDRLDGARDVSAIGNTLFVSARAAGGITAVDISDPTDPTVITTTRSSSYDNAYGNTNDGQHIYAPSTSTGQLTVTRWLEAPAPGRYGVAGGLLVPVT